MLLAAGLVASRRDGRTLLHLRTARADSLLNQPAARLNHLAARVIDSGRP